MRALPRGQVKRITVPVLLRATLIPVQPGVPAIHQAGQAIRHQEAVHFLRVEQEAAHHPPEAARGEEINQKGIQLS